MCRTLGRPFLAVLFQAATQLRPRDFPVSTVPTDARKRKHDHTDEFVDGSHAGIAIRFACVGLGSS